MGERIYDYDEPLDFTGLERRFRFNHNEAFCPGCGAWVAINQFYNSERLVILAVPHIYPCEHFEDFLKSKRRIL